MATVRGPRLLEVTIQVCSRRHVSRRRLDSQIEAGGQGRPSGPAADAVHVRSPDMTGTSPVPPSTPDEVRRATGKPTDSAPRRRRREAEPQRRLTGWSRCAVPALAKNAPKK